jgi:UDP-N-acetylglucosamine 2-epimerase (non-hydrolysing)
MPIKAMLVFGTRPEALKLCPLALHLREHPAFCQVRVCVTAQHRDLLDSALATFGILPDYDLDIMSDAQTLAEVTSRVLSRLDPVLAAESPDIVYVQGDTTSTLAGALGAFYRRIPVAHVEAGLRTGDLTSPFPEEINRVLTGRLCALHFAPTERAACNLRREGLPESALRVTGNTGIDALLWVRARLLAGQLPGYDGPAKQSGKHLILVTAHRRENFGAGLDGICTALLRLAARGDCNVVYPVHPNPRIREHVKRRLGKVRGIHLIEPLEYVSFVDLMRRSDLILTDSGGIQEEAPALGKPVLVLRESTERQEAIEAGTAILVGTNPDVIFGEASRLLDCEPARRAMTSVHNPFGRGQACRLIADATVSFFRGISPHHAAVSAPPVAPFEHRTACGERL